MDIYYIIVVLFFICVTLPCFNYILKSLIFIKPFTEKYKIMAKDLGNNIHGRFKFILICIMIIFYVLYSFKNNLIIFFLYTLVLIVYGIYLYRLYSHFTILNFINEFSSDLFDWHKIYSSTLIDQETKIKCFQIHHLDYDEFLKKHLSYLKFQAHDINCQINDLKKKLSEKEENESK